MSSSVNVTSSPVTMPSQRISFNVDYLRRLPGQLKLAELVLGVICVSVIAHYFISVHIFFGNLTFESAKLFFITISVTFFIGTFCLLTSCLMSPTTATAISRTEYEVVYHGVAFFLYLAASITLLVECNRGKTVETISKIFPVQVDITPYVAASVMGLLTSVLYLLSTYFAYNIYQGN